MGTFNNIKDAQKEVMEKLGNIGKGTAISVFNNIIIGSPVDTGAFRGNWQVTLNTPAPNIIAKETAKGRAEEASTSIAPMKLTEIAYLTNNLPYAEPLEYGWSTQRPIGWVRSLVAEGQKALDEAVKKVQ